jgi:peroxiredoxin
MSQSASASGGRFAYLAFILLVLGAATGCEKGGGGSEAASPGGGEHPLLGAAAPDFDLPAYHAEKRVSLEKGKGKVTIVDFWATWCEPCRESFPAYQALSEKFEDRLVVIGISEDDSPDGIAEFAKATGVRFPLAWDEGQAVSKQYQPPTMPTSYVIDGDGIVRFVHAGFHEGDEAKIESTVARWAK